MQLKISRNFIACQWALHFFTCKKQLNTYNRQIQTVNHLNNNNVIMKKLTLLAIAIYLLSATNANASNRLYADNTLEASDGFVWDWSIGAGYFIDKHYLQGVEYQNGFELNINLAINYDKFYFDIDHGSVTTTSPITRLPLLPRLAYAIRRDSLRDASDTARRAYRYFFCGERSLSCKTW